MIKRIEYIKNMGIYHDFSWDLSIENDFSKVNVLYGRNYSGKTTLSRIIRCLELRRLHKHYPCSEFRILFSKGEEISEKNVETEQKSYLIRVFNSDFIVENLSFLVMPSCDGGEIKPFAVLGSKNNALESRRREIMGLLGRSNSNQRGGLDGKLKGATTAVQNIASKIEELRGDIDSLVTSKAISRSNGIKYNHKKYGDQNYTKVKLYKHIEYVINEKLEPLSDEERNVLLAAVEESAKPHPTGLYTFSSILKYLRDVVADLLGRNITAGKRIQELCADYALEQWVRSGVDRHQNKSEVCLFCGSPISDSRWNELKNHFDRASETLKTDIACAIKKIESYRQEFEREYNFDTVNFYSLHHKQIEKVLSLMEKVKTKYLSLLSHMSERLHEREKNITTSFSFNDDTEIDAIATEAVGEYKKLKDDTIEYTKLLNNKIKEAQEKLLYDEVLLFIKENDYVNRKECIDRLENAKNKKEEEQRQIEAEIKMLEEELDEIAAQITSERKAAELVNEYLSLFSCDSLRLNVSEGGPSGALCCHFDVVRGQKRALNLSDGERSLIAFCYFLAKLDEINNLSHRPIVWIDDPISSLDNDHVFMTYSLLRGALVESGKVEQLFVSTHNLEFFKYLTRLTESPSLYLISRTKSNARITCLPDYMKKHVTEFNYLFKQIYMCAYSQLENATDEVYYNFGNNARKFLELYLFYKYPDHNMKHVVKMSRFFGNDVAAYFVNRVDNERSHLMATFERAQLMVDIPELKHVAKLIVETIRDKDNEQYKALLSSVGLEVHANAIEIEQD